jgi:hypothetical protein
MIGNRCLYSGILCSGILIALMTAGPAVAQSRNGNVWGGVAHQPSAPSVRSDEKVKEILPSPQEQTRQDHILDRLGRDLLERSGSSR